MGRGSYSARAGDSSTRLIRWPHSPDEAAYMNSSNGFASHFLTAGDLGQASPTPKSEENPVSPRINQREAMPLSGEYWRRGEDEETEMEDGQQERRDTFDDGSVPDLSDGDDPDAHAHAGEHWGAAAPGADQPVQVEPEVLGEEASDAEARVPHSVPMPGVWCPECVKGKAKVKLFQFK